MNRKTIHHDRRVTVCLTTEEFEKVEAWAKETTSQTISEYMRNVITKKPVTFKVRNQSAEDFLETAVDIKNNLTAINESLLKQVNALFRSPESGPFKMTIGNIDATVFSIQQKTEAIKWEMNQIYKLCSQK